MTTLLEAAQWRDLAAEHESTVDELIAAHRGRAANHRRHPVEDFLFTYYRARPAQLRAWHPGLGYVLVDADRNDWRFYRTFSLADRPGRGSAVDLDDFLTARADSVRYVWKLLSSTAGATAQFGCFGLHEWAMVFEDAADRRHSGWPLRLGADGTDEVVRTHQIRCSHYDAFRFFTSTARPRNLLQPTLDDRIGLEQPGCLHATMDLYKWAYKLSPVVPSDLLIDCFRLSREIREMDMRASPYDLTELGLAPIAIETTDGKAAYVAGQRHFAAAGQHLRRRLLEALAPAVGRTEASVS